MINNLYLVVCRYGHLQYECLGFDLSGGGTRGSKFNFKIRIRSFKNPDSEHTGAVLQSRFFFAGAGAGFFGSAPAPFFSK